MRRKWLRPQAAAIAIVCKIPDVPFRRLTSGFSRHSLSVSNRHCCDLSHIVSGNRPIGSIHQGAEGALFKQREMKMSKCKLFAVTALVAMSAIVSPAFAREVCKEVS